MGFGVLLGLIGLIGIPVLIIIYILKPKFQERKISSTYIWKLSLKYRKRKIPLQWLKSLLLIVQCLCVLVMTFLIAQPYLARSANSYAYEKVVIIDSSASMMTVSNGKSRFERAIEEASKIAETASGGKEMTVILAGEVPTTIVDFEETPGFIKGKLEQAKCEGGVANYNSAIIEAQQVLERNPNAGITLITDHEFESTGYINLINVAQNEWNLAIDDAWDDTEADEESKDFGETILVANICSYNTDLKIIPCAKITYKSSTTSQTNTDADYNTVTVKNPAVQLEANKAQQIVFEYQTLRAALHKRLSSYKAVEFYCEDEAGNVLADSFADDDKFFLYGGESTNFKVLLVGEDSFFLSNAVQSVGKCDVTHLYPSENAFEISQATKGYDLYIYDNFVPTTYPVDGAIWMINPQQGSYASLGFNIGSAQSTSLTGAVINTKSAGHAIMKNIAETTGVIDGSFGVFSYTRYSEASISSDAKYMTSLVTTPSGSPLIFAGENTKRIKTTVFAFNLSYTDYPLIFKNFPIMIQNMVDYSASKTLTNYLYEIGEKATVNIRPNTTKMEISVGSGDNLTTVKYEGSSALSKPVDFKVTRGGVYTISQTLLNADGTESVSTEQFFVRCNTDESNFALKGGVLVGNEYIQSNDATAKKEVRDYIYQWFAGALVLFLLIEWGLQYREQY